MKTIYDIVMAERLRQQHKHDLGSQYAITQLRSLRPEEFLRELSDAIEQRLQVTPEAQPIAALSQQGEAVYTARATAFREVLALIAQGMNKSGIKAILSDEVRAADMQMSVDDWRNAI